MFETEICSKQLKHFVNLYGTLLSRLKYQTEYISQPSSTTENKVGIQRRLLWEIMKKMGNTARHWRRKETKTETLPSFTCSGCEFI